MITSKVRLDIMGKNWTLFLKLKVCLLFRVLIRYCGGRGVREPYILSPDHSSAWPFLA